MKVLIITYYWPPAGGPGVQRWLKFVKYLPQFGISPIVYTVENAAYPIIDETLLAEVPQGITVLKQPIKEPNAWFSFLRKKNKESAGFLDPNPSFLGKAMQYIRANYFIPDARKFWVKPSVEYLTTFVKENSVDVIISTGPPHSLHLIGMELKKKLNLKWITDFRDPWTDIDYFHQLPLTKSSLQKHQKLEKEVINHADKVIVVSEQMKKVYLKYNDQVEVITNGFDGHTTKNKGSLDPEFSIVHVGMMNADRNPKLLWKVLKELSEENREFNNDLHIKLIGKVADEVIENLRENGLMQCTERISYLAHLEVLEFQQKAQVLLLCVNKVPSAKGIVTGKIFEYLQAQRPVVAIAPVDGDLASIILKTGSGFVVGFDDEEEMKAILKELYSLYKKGNLTVGTQNIDQYHRKNLTKELAISIQKLFAQNK